jgi:hypothetical protein
VTAPWTTADDARLRTWLVEVVSVARPDLGTGRPSGDEIRFGANDGLSVNKRTGAWRHYPSGEGGYRAIRLLELLIDQPRPEVEKWVKLFLDNHAGEGPANAAADEEAEAEGVEAYASAREAQYALYNAVPLPGTDGNEYLRLRGIGLTEDHVDVLWLADARVGEGAVIGVLRSHGRRVGVQRIHVDPFGRKSLVRPVSKYSRQSNLRRMRFLRSTRHPTSSILSRPNLESMSFTSKASKTRLR